MKKKLFAILLSLIMILSSVSILSEVSFAEGYDINKIKIIAKVVKNGETKYYGVKTYNNQQDHLEKEFYKITKEVYDEVAEDSLLRFARVELSKDANGNETKKELPFKLRSAKLGGDINGPNTSTTLEEGAVFTEVYLRHHMAYEEGFVATNAPHLVEGQGADTYLIDLKKDWIVDESGFKPDNPNNWILIDYNCILEGNGKTIKRTNVNPKYQIVEIGSEQRPREDNPNPEVTIRNLTVDGTDKFVCIQVNEKRKLSLENVKVKNGKGTSVEGGGISVHDKATLNMDKDCEISNCTNKYGGAIYADDEVTININDSKIFNNTSKGGGAIAVLGSGGKVNITGTTFENNSSDGPGGAIYSNSSITIDKDENDQRTIFNGNQANGKGGAIYQTKNTLLTINNSNFEENTSILDGGAIYVSYKAKAKIEDTNFMKNSSEKTGGAISFEYENANESTILKSHFEENNAKWGGAISTGKGSKIKVGESDFIKNIATLDGGAIYTSDKKYENKVDTSKDYQNLTIDENTIFTNNKAKGYFNPPENVKDLTNIKFKRTTFTGTKKINPDSPLNNYDINYKRDIVVTYDPNDGNEAVEDKQKEKEVKGYEIKSVKDLKFTNTSKFLEWNTKADGTGTSYQVGDKVDLTGNLYLYAIWEKPAPKPAEPSTVILTLDENHRGGEITNIEVEEGDLIEPHLYIPRRRGYIFRGWSYDQKHLDEVKPGDRIYSDTTLYAIWKRAEEERAEEPEEIKGEDHKAYIFGYPNGTVRPNGSITRAEAAAMLARLLNIEAIGSAAKPQFTDTDSSWYNKAINAVVFRGIMKGYPDGRFRPNAPITRAEFTQMISTIDNKPYGVAPFADVPGHWAERAIGSEYQAKRITGYPDGLFRPDANITRAEAAVILNKIFERKYDNLSLLKCKNPQMIKRFTDLNESFWGWNDMVEATNTHEYVRREKNKLPEDWLLIKDINDIK